MFFIFLYGCYGKWEYYVSYLWMKSNEWSTVCIMALCTYTKRIPWNNTINIYMFVILWCMWQECGNCIAAQNACNNPSLWRVFRYFFSFWLKTNCRNQKNLRTNEMCSTKSKNDEDEENQHQLYGDWNGFIGSYPTIVYTFV